MVATAAKPEPLTTNEQQRLHALEQVVRRGINVYRDVGDALLQIRDQRLYRAKFSTFERYCAEQWGLSKRHANRVIEAAGVANNIEEQVGRARPIPETIRQASELAVLPDELQAEVWEDICAENPTPTAQEVRDGVQRFAAENFERLSPTSQARIVNAEESVIAEWVRERRMGELRRHASKALAIAKDLHVSHAEELLAKALQYIPGANA